tara:strand:+ start:3473 stop:4480 length:1008 start_codon:yes stop_codon:yes gene_type:complete
MSICAISTCWRAGLTNDAKELIETMKETGISSLELEFRISSETFEEIKKNFTAWGIKIVSLHAVCPSPQGRIRGAEQYLISDIEEENRVRGVDQVKQTLRNVADVGAQAIIVHCGRVPEDEPINIMKQFYDDGKIQSKEAEISLQEISQNRTAKKGKNFEALLKSLDEINAEAEKFDINVGLENRYYFFEFPDMNELKTIFSRFKGGKLAYWHDTGHAQVNETLFGISQRGQGPEPNGAAAPVTNKNFAEKTKFRKLISQENLLKTFHDHLIGIHLHDVLNGYTDHNAPGCGTVDFDMVKSYLKPETIRVMEINQEVSPADAKKGIAFLRDKGIF